MVKGEQENGEKNRTRSTDIVKRKERNEQKRGKREQEANGETPLFRNASAEVHSPRCFIAGQLVLGLTSAL